MNPLDKEKNEERKKISTSPIAREFNVFSFLLGQNWYSFERISAMGFIVTLIFIGISLIKYDGTGLQNLVTLALTLIGYLAGLNSRR
jgi:hypothetical protein